MLLLYLLPFSLLLSYFFIDKNNRRVHISILQIVSILILYNAPKTLLRDLDVYIIDIGELTGHDINETIVLLLMIVSWSLFLRLLRIYNYSIASIYGFYVLAFPTLACNQLRLLFALLIFLIFSNRKSIFQFVYPVLIHKSMLIVVFIKTLKLKKYFLVFLVLFILFFINTNFEDIFIEILPYLGNLSTYINASEISNIYVSRNFFEGIEFPLFFIFISWNNYKKYELIGLVLIYIYFKNLDIPSVILLRLYELGCYLIFLLRYKRIKLNFIEFSLISCLLLLRFIYHYQ